MWVRRPGSSSYLLYLVGRRERSDFLCVSPYCQLCLFVNDLIVILNTFSTNYIPDRLAGH